MGLLTFSYGTLIGAAMLLTGSQAIAEWAPTKNVEIVVPYSVGGGSDLNARLLAEVIKQESLMDRVPMVVNRPGGNGAIGTTYTASQIGSGEAIMTFNSGQMTSMIANPSSVQLSGITPLATMAMDTLVLAVPIDAPYNTFSELAQAAGASSGKMTIAGAARGSLDHIAFEMVNEKVDGILQYVPFDGSGASLVALLGGHVDAALFNPGEISAQITANKAKAIGIFTSERVDGEFANVPTLREQGYEGAVVEMFRGYAGPPDMTEEQITYWGNLLHSAFDSKIWQEALAKDSLIPRFEGPAESAAYWADEEARYKKVLEAVGLIN